MQFYVKDKSSRVLEIRIVRRYCDNLLLNAARVAYVVRMTYRKRDGRSGSN